MPLSSSSSSTGNVARCWAYETSVVLNETLPDALPPNDYIEYYRPDYRCVRRVM